MLWFFVAIAITYALDSPDLTHSPSWRVTAGEGEPLDLPWWMAPMLAITAMGTVHATLNLLRRS